MKPRDLLSQQEMDALLRKSDLRGAVEIFTTWGLIALAFAGVALWPHLPTIFIPLLLAWVLLGNRHLALAILVHDAGHHAVFKTDRLADISEIKFKGRILILIKPSTYMNLSGESIREVVNFYKISNEEIIVIYNC